MAFTPKPFLILSAVQDVFPIEGTRRTFGEVKQRYGVMGAYGCVTAPVLLPWCCCPGVAALVLLHAAALDDRIKSVVLENMLVWYESVVTEKISRKIFENIVPGVRAKYDLTDLAAALAPRRVAIVNPVNPQLGGNWRAIGFVYLLFLTRGFKRKEELGKW